MLKSNILFVFGCVSRRVFDVVIVMRQENSCFLLNPKVRDVNLKLIPGESSSGVFILLQQLWHSHMDRLSLDSLVV